MKNLYKTLNEQIDTRPHFQLKYLIIRCPAFIANALMRRRQTPATQPKRWWADYPRVEDVQGENNTVQYIPKYQ